MARPAISGPPLRGGQPFRRHFSANFWFWAGDYSLSLDFASRTVPQKFIQALGPQVCGPQKMNDANSPAEFAPTYFQRRLDGSGLAAMANAGWQRCIWAEGPHLPAHSRRQKPTIRENVCDGTSLCQDP